MPGHAFLLVRLPGLGPQPIPSSRTPSSAVFYLTPLSGASPGCRPLLGPTVSLLLWGLIKGIYTSLRLLLLILQRLRCESPLEDCLPASAIWLSEVSLDPQSFPSLLLESYLARRPALSRWPLRLCLVSAPPPTLTPHPTRFALCSGHTGISVPSFYVHLSMSASPYSLFSPSGVPFCPFSPTQCLALILSKHHVLRDSFPDPTLPPIPLNSPLIDQIILGKKKKKPYRDYILNTCLFYTPPLAPLSLPKFNICCFFLNFFFSLIGL